MVGLAIGKLELYFFARFDLREAKMKVDLVRSLEVLQASHIGTEMLAEAGGQKTYESSGNSIPVQLILAKDNILLRFGSIGCSTWAARVGQGISKTCTRHYRGVWVRY